MTYHLLQLLADACVGRLRGKLTCSDVVVGADAFALSLGGTACTYTTLTKLLTVALIRTSLINIF